MKINRRAYYFIFLENLGIVLITVLKKQLLIYVLPDIKHNLIILNVLYTVIKIISNILDYIFG